MAATNRYRRSSAWEINSFPKAARGITNISGDGATIPLIYGRDSTSGYKFAEAVSGGYLYIGILWCLGPIKSVKLVEINDAPVPSGVSVRHYLGHVDQGVDSWLAAAIPGYDDDLVYVLPGGSAPAAYSVFKIASGALDGVPRIRAIIQGKLVYDPDAGANSDPNWGECGIIVDFESGGADTSQFEHTITLHNGATIDSGGLQLDGTDDYASIVSHPALDVTDQEFCIEVVFTADDAGASPQPLQTIYTNTDVSSPSRNSIRLDLSGTDLLLYLSTTGTTWDLANAVDVGTVSTNRAKFTLERVGNELLAFLDGVETWRTSAVSGSPETALAIFSDDASPAVVTWYLGQFNASQYLDGKIHAFRILVGDYRYGSSHVATAIPFADSDTYGAQVVYSVLPALVWGDIATSTLYGLGATIDGLSEARAWGESLLDDGSARTKIAFSITSPRRAEDWLDLMATYAVCVWFPEGSNLRIQPDERQSSERPSGLEIVSNGIFDAPASPQEWTLGTGWSIGSGVLSCAITSPQVSSDVTQTLTTEADVVYAVSFTISAYTSGSVTVLLGGVTAIASQSAEGTYTAFITPTGTSTQLKITKAAGSVLSIDNVSVKRSAYKESQWLQGSLSISGPSERDTPTSVAVKYTKAETTTANWNEATVVRTLPDAEDATIPFIQTTLDMSGLHDEERAAYQGVMRLQRMYRRLDVSYVTTDHAVMHRVGDAIELDNTYRGASATIWVDDVETIGYGRHRVSGVLYSLLHFPDSDELGFYSASSYLDKLVEIVEKGSIGGVWILDEADGNANPPNQAFGGLYPCEDFGTPRTGEPSFMDDGRTATEMDGSNRYENPTLGNASGIKLAGTFGLIFDYTGGGSDWNAMRIDPSSTDHMSMLYINSTTLRVALNAGSGVTSVDFTGSYTGDRVMYLVYSLPAGTNQYTLTLYNNFVLQETKTGTVSAGTWNATSGADMFIGGTSGAQEGVCQYAFVTDHSFTDSDVAELQEAFNRNFVGYAPS